MRRHDETTATTPSQPKTADDLEQVLNNFREALNAGASVTFTYSGATAMVTVECAEGTFTGYGKNAVAALDRALAALPEQ